MKEIRLLIDRIENYDLEKFNPNIVEKNLISMLVKDGVLTLTKQFYKDNIKTWTDDFTGNQIIDKIDGETFEEIFDDIPFQIKVIPRNADPDFILKHINNKSKFNKTAIIDRTVNIHPKILQELMTEINNYDLLYQLCKSQFSKEQIEHIVYHSLEFVRFDDEQEINYMITQINSTVLKYQECDQKIIDFIVRQNHTLLPIAVFHNFVSDEFLNKYGSELPKYDILVSQKLSNTYIKKFKETFKESVLNQFQNIDTYEVFEKIHFNGNIYIISKLKNSTNYNLRVYGEKEFNDITFDELNEIIKYSPEIKDGNNSMEYNLRLSLYDKVNKQNESNKK